MQAEISCLVLQFVSEDITQFEERGGEHGAAPRISSRAAASRQDSSGELHSGQPCRSSRHGHSADGAAAAVCAAPACVCRARAGEWKRSYLSALLASVEVVLPFVVQLLQVRAGAHGSDSQPAGLACPLQAATAAAAARPCTRTPTPLRLRLLLRRLPAAPRPHLAPALHAAPSGLVPSWQRRRRRRPGRDGARACSRRVSGARHAGRLCGVGAAGAARRQQRRGGLLVLPGRPGLPGLCARRDEAGAAALGGHVPPLCLACHSSLCMHAAVPVCCPCSSVSH